MSRFTEHNFFDDLLFIILRNYFSDISPGKAYILGVK